MHCEVCCGGAKKWDAMFCNDRYLINDIYNSQSEFSIFILFGIFAPFTIQIMVFEH